MHRDKQLQRYSILINWTHLILNIRWSKDTKRTLIHEDVNVICTFKHKIFQQNCHTNIHVTQVAQDVHVTAGLR